MRTLTQAEATERARLLDVASYDVLLDLTAQDGFGSVTEVRFSCREPGASTFLELDGELVSVVRGGALVEAALDGNRLHLHDLAADEVVTITARCKWSATGEGLQRSVDPADGRTYVYAQTFLDDCQRLMACFDQPDLKAVFRLTVDAPDGWTVLGNARVSRDGTRHVLAPTERIATYLVTLAAGPWHGVTSWHDGIELGVWCRQSMAEHLEADELLDLTRRSFDLQQRVFGQRYPFGDSYDQVFVPDFNAGAMENPGMVTFSEELFLFRSRVTTGTRRMRGQVIAHEMAHMWFGDLVTMRWWDDLWLNESFAEMLGVHTVDRALPYDGAWADFCVGRKAWGYETDQRPTTHPVSGEVADTRAALLNFDGISYAKGASVLRQLMAAVGEDVFFTGVRDYLQRHAWGNSTVEDLLAAVEAASGRDLTAWAQVWLRTSGVNVLRVQDGAVVQSGAPLRPHRVGIGAYDDVGGRLRLRERWEADVSGARTPVPGLTGAALVLPNDGDLTYAKVRFDDASLAVVLARVGDLEDPLARAVCWGSLWDACRDGELPAADFVSAVLGGLDAEEDPDVVRALLAQALTAATSYSSDGAVLRAALADDCLRRVSGSADLQLVAARAAADTAETPAQREAVLGWLDGAGVPDGLVVDSDLRWHLLGRLAAVGVVDVGRLRVERTADRTDAGERGHARAWAAVPDAAVKAAVWAELFEGVPSANRTRALSGAFWQHGQDDLLRRYADRYLAAVPAVFEDCSPEVAATLAAGLFPRTLVEAGLVERVDELLSRHLPAPLRRILLERQADLVRALAARACT